MKLKNDKLDLEGISIVIIGAQTNPDRQPDEKWVKNIQQQCEAKGIKCLLKSNLRGKEIK